MVKCRNLILRNRVVPISPYLKPEFEDSSSTNWYFQLTGFKVIRNYVWNFYRPTDRKQSDTHVHMNFLAYFEPNNQTTKFW